MSHLQVGRGPTLLGAEMTGVAFIRNHAALDVATTIIPILGRSQAEGESQNST